MKSLAIVGGAVIGLACAVRAAESGWQVTVYDPGHLEPQRGGGLVSTAASRVAAGMLGIAGESRTGDDVYLAFAEQAMSRWPEFVDRLGDDQVVEAPYSGESVRVRSIPWRFAELVPLATRPGTTPNGT